MGVSLERVQYKFASIIGELCSEPFILSQFAVWLDLRLAEYKSKGSISLDCCGSLPEPDWLKGLKISPGDTNPNLIKDSGTGDAGESFFSLSLENQKPVNLGVENSSHSLDSLSQSVPACNDFPQHNSYTNKQTSRKGSRESYSIHVNEEDSSSDVVLLADEDAHTFPDSYRTPHSDELQKLSSMTSFTSGQVESFHQDFSPGQTHSANYTSRYSPYRLVDTPNHDKTGFQEGKLKRTKNSTERNVLAAVRSVHRWMQESPRNDNRPVTELSAETLDEYLMEFFSIVKKASGEDYTRRSFEVFRYSLDRYLKEKNYPHSICRSPLFVKSQQSFLARKLSLREAADSSAVYVSRQFVTPNLLKSVSNHSAESVRVSANEGDAGGDNCGFQKQIPIDSGGETPSATWPSTSASQNIVSQAREISEETMHKVKQTESPFSSSDNTGFS